MALKATIVALALSSVDSFAPAATGAPRRPAFAIIIRQTFGMFSDPMTADDFVAKL